MDEPVITFASKKNTHKAANILVILGLLIGLFILSLAGYSVYREYQNKYAKIEPNVRVDSTNVLQPQFAQREKVVETPSTTYSVNKEKVLYLNSLINQLGDNTKFLTSMSFSFTIEANIQEIKNEGAEFTLTLRDSANNLININLTSEEVGKVKVYSESPGYIEDLSFFDLKHNDRVRLTGTINMTGNTANKFQIKVLSR